LAECLIAEITLVISKEALVPNTFRQGVGVAAEADFRPAFAAESTASFFLVTEENLAARL
jgi:hypothetical protein